MTAARKLMTADEFLVWRLEQEGTWELVDGVPQLKFENPTEMMAGGTRNQALVAANLLLALGPRLKGSGCRPIGSDFAVLNLEGGSRQPDVTVICGRGRGGDLAETEPRAVFEVLSPSTRHYDLVKKAEEYRRLPSLAHLVLLEADRPRALVWTREGADWRLVEVEGSAGEIDLSAMGVTVPMSEAHEDVDLYAAG